MKTTNGFVFNANEAMVTLLKIPWPVKVSYGLVKLSAKLSEQFKIVEECRVGLVQKHGTENGNKGEVGVPEGTPAYKAFVAEYDELMAQEVELVIKKVRLPTEVDGKSILVEPITLMALEGFVAPED